jgi:hypothetical protein
VIITVSIPDEYGRRLQEIAAELHRSAADLAESAITEAVLAHDRHKPAPRGRCWLGRTDCLGSCGSYGCEGR